MSLKNILRAAVVFALAAVGGCAPLKKGESGMEKNVQYIIDVRTQTEFDAGHVEGALLIPNTEISSRIRTAVPDLQSPIALYCRSGRRAGQAKEIMAQLGYSKVVNLGGLEDAAESLNRKIVRK